MPETSLEKLVPEKDFVLPLEQRSQILFRLSNTLRASGGEPWLKRHFFQLHTEADELESFLDDYGARYNKTYHTLTEIVASIRGFALAGMSLEHLARRFAGYGLSHALTAEDLADGQRAVLEVRAFVQSSAQRLLHAFEDEARSLGLRVATDTFPQDGFQDGVLRFSLPRNVGQEELQDEEQKIAEVASKYLQACTMFEQSGVRRIADPAEIESFMQARCTEEHARVYEATVHNLQSAYDTHIGNTVIEGRDKRLPRLRGHISASLHLLEAVTQLTHFVERHESGQRSEAAEKRLSGLVPRDQVRRATLNTLLYWAHRAMLSGRHLAEELLPSYTNVQTLEIEIDDDLNLHARPVSLIVGIVAHYGTPVEAEVAGRVCNAGSILELMIAVGSQPDCRRILFRGDENPLRDIGLLFEAGLGENGLDGLPEELRYLKRS